MSLHRLLGFTTAVPDPAALVAYWTELGLAGDTTAGFSGSSGGGAVRAVEGAFRRLDQVEIGCTADHDLTSLAARLDGLGAAPQRTDDAVHATDPTTTVRFTVRVAEAEAALVPTTLTVPNAPGAIGRVNERAPAVFGAPRPPRRLGHLVIGTPDLAATRAFLVDGLGLKVSDEIDGVIAFLRCSTDHHNVALVHSAVPLLQHYSWECDDVDHLGHAATALVRVDPTRHCWGLGRHFAGSNFYWYVRDPAGAFLELYSDLDRITDDDAWEQTGRTAFDFQHIANAWGPNLPTEFVVPDDEAELVAAWAARDR